eukprot:8690699-Pyramimonas_sp.AAC.1
MCSTNCLLGTCPGAFRPCAVRNGRCHSTSSSRAPSRPPTCTETESGARPFVASAGTEVDVTGLLGRGAARPVSACLRRAAKAAA